VSTSAYCKTVTLIHGHITGLADFIFFDSWPY